MLASKLYSPTLRELPADAVVMSHKYMLKAGMMRKIANGTYAYLPLAFRAIEKVKRSSVRRSIRQAHRRS